MSDHTQKFSGKAEDYDAGRPSYPRELVDFILAESGTAAGDAVADVGAGTGIFTRQLLERGLKVFAVEPNADMRGAAVRRCGASDGFLAVAGDASHTGLSAGSVKLVTAAQAFHWFDVAAFRAECERIAGGGYAAIVYNNRTGGEANAVFDEICARYSREFRGRAGHDGQSVSAFFGGAFRTFTVSNPVTCDKDTFIRTLLSRSYAPAKGSAEYERLAEELERRFLNIEKDGRVTVQYESVAYIGKINERRGVL